MPVIVEHLAQPSAQDRQDLARLYAEAPAWLLAPFADGEALVDAALAAGTLLTGRFNDRLLGAAWLQRDADAWRLSRLCVRRVTRGRGVARRLLEEAQRQAVLAGCPLRLQAPAGQAEAAELAAHLGLALETAEAP
ncbi:acetyl-CoA sensor PanZ family protein [Pseudomonas citronellolis]|uniref:acetyl-CoA sensor PanZ family protein n=1 Tax=Pseudomonas citronellolis TaxID=53408 RepID=UPI0018D7FB08|nr:acetyl-CoA sensor PanZ family protein [Pseudomonas citronellolis]MBH3431437.1 acetyl-CoA sensor PanZ family protein [Pseudomonas citronellolis]